MVTTINPSSGEMLQTYAFHTPEEVNAILENLHQGWGQWKSLTFEDRKLVFLTLAKKLLDKKEEYARLMTLEMGKPIRFARSEIEKCAWACEYFAESAEQYLKPEIITTSLAKSIIHYQPYGIILGIMPWNFPFWQVFRAVATCIMAGNVFLLKHAPISTGTSLAIEALFKEVSPSIPLLRSVILNEEATAGLIEHPKVAGITLTGSVRAGRSVAEQAAKSLKKCVLELGGIDPYIVLADADLSLAAELCVQGRLANSGQICIAPKRLIIVQEVYEAFREKVLELVKRYACDDPLKEETLLGPMARSDLRDTVHQQVQASLAKGAKLLVGGESFPGKGFYYPATVIENVKPGMPAFDEELFGPVIELIQAADEEEAIYLANLTPYGLGAGVFTKNISHGEEIATHRVEAGACHVNSLVSSDPRLPFGGRKMSGLGYELGLAGIREFVHIKTVGIA